MEVSDYVPDGLHPMQYGLHILQEILGWPAKGNCELMAECLQSIAKAKRLNDKQAYKYMVRAITLAKEQGVTVDGHFLRNGEYMNMRPGTKQYSTVGCDDVCRSRHGRGYHENDMKWLWKRVMAEKKADPDRHVSAAEIWGMLDELDKKRAAGTPEWRISERESSSVGNNAGFSTSHGAGA